MECNKDEAVRAKEIAEKKFLERDITGAKKFALKAQSLFPKLDGLSQFLEIINVNVVHEKKINGEANYYEILGVDPFADELVLKKQYRRMALSLHPDKNRSVGADEAFKLLSRAWDVLSDMDKRSSYNLKINIRGSNQTGGEVLTRPKSSPGTASCHQQNPTSSTSGTKHHNIPSHQQTPAAASTFGPPYNPETCKPFSDVKRRRTDAQKCDSANKGTTKNVSGVKTGSTNPKGNLSSTNTETRNQTRSFSSSSAKYNTSTTNPKPVRKSTPGIATCRQYASTPHNPTNTTSGTRSQNITSHRPTATAFGPTYNCETYIPFSDLNKAKPVKRSRTDVHKCDSANKGSQRTAGNGSGVKKGPANSKGNLSSTTHEGMRNQIGSLSSSCAKYTTISATNPKPVPTRPKTPGTTTRRHCTSGSGFKHIPSRHQTPAAATVTGKLCNPVSSLNREKPVKTGPTNSAKEGSQGFKWGSTNLKGNISTTHSVIRKHSSDQKTVKNK